MGKRTAVSIVVCGVIAGCSGSGGPERAGGASAEREHVGGAVDPLVIGESFSLDSKIMDESRRINVFAPTIYGQKIEEPMPVLYVLDGGVDEDFLHIAGLVQILVCNGGMRPFLLVGIQNTVRRRDMTGPTSNEEDKKIAPVVGGAAVFRDFMKRELMPAVRARYRVTEEAAIVGESLAGLFVVETFLLEPALFDTYIAFDPSLWWANAELVGQAETRLEAGVGHPRAMFIGSSAEPEMLRLTGELARIIQRHAGEGFAFHYMPFRDEGHGTIYHPGALAAFRTVFAPEARAGSTD